MNLTKELQNIGLTDKEAKVYLAALELGQNSVQNIAKKSGVNRATTYVILNSLIQKGLCSTYQQDKKTLYIASDPAQLEGIFEIQKKELEEKQKYLKTIVSQLQLINNKQTNKPVVKFFEGKQGLINCFVEFTNSGNADPNADDFRVVFSKDKLDQLFTDEERKKFVNIRLKKQAKSKGLYNSKILTMQDTPESSRIKVSDSQFPFPCDIGVFGDNVRILSEGKKLSGILITDKDVATMRSLFELAWEAAQARMKKNK
jgi:predicted transcriptional regulator